MSDAPRWKHVWITGASSGLGENLARQLAAQGCTVTISARSKDKLDAIASSSPTIHAHPLDVTDHDAAKALVEEIEAARGPVDLAVFSAGAWFQSGVRDMKVENYRKTFDVNVMGVVHCLDAVMPRMIERGSGRIGIVASVAGYGGLPRSGAYGPSKAALINMAEAMHVELKELGVDLSVINPGFVKTPMTAKNEFPMPFLMEPEDAARKMIDGLKSDDFEIAFPWQLVTMLKRLNGLPYKLYFAATRRMLKR